MGCSSGGSCNKRIGLLVKMEHCGHRIADDTFKGIEIGRPVTMS